jgi:heterodisulfide reductase subunit A
MAMGIRYVRAAISKTFEMPGSKNLSLVYAGSDMALVEEEFDMIVLSVGLEPSDSLKRQAKDLDIELNRFGFAATEGLNPLELSRPGVFVGGAFQEPKDIPDTVMQATGAAGRAMALLAPSRGELVKTKPYPPERDIADEPPRIGVFVCHCGSNIASVVDVASVSAYAKKLPNVAYADHNTYVCADDTQQLLKERIQEHSLNRVIVASCTPRTHEPIFRDTLKEVGLNPYLLEMANIRDQCSWVHSGEPEAATNKARDLIRMAVSRAAHLEPLQDDTVPVSQAALVIGGGIAGMTAALAMADQGFPVHLVEQTAELGGIARRIPTTLDGGDVAQFVRACIQKVNNHPKITVHMEAEASRVEGHVGAFKSTLVSGDQSTQVEHGVVVVATGATEMAPTSYEYGKDRRVLTQLELSERLGNGRLKLPKKPTIAMIQCVEQRTEERPYCSRVCCATAVKNALALKERYPKARIVVLYRDMRTYGFREAAYRKAREQGILFIRYDVDQPPTLEANGSLELTVREPALDAEIVIEPDLLVLAAPVIPRSDREVISELLRVPLNADGYFVEAHMKLRPVDFASEGLFLCGTAHAPKFINETLSQATAVSGRAASILSKQRMKVSGQTAWVNPDSCISCMTCVHVCPYLAPRVGKNNKAEVQNAVCMGCGSCTAECPAQAITLRHYGREQVLSAIAALLGHRTAESKEEIIFPEQTGIAQPHWR